MKKAYCVLGKHFPHQVNVSYPAPETEDDIWPWPDDPEEEGAKVYANTPENLEKIQRGITEAGGVDCEDCFNAVGQTGFHPCAIVDDETMSLIVDTETKIGGVEVKYGMDEAERRSLAAAMTHIPALSGNHSSDAIHQHHMEQVARLAATMADADRYPPEAAQAA